MSTVTQRIMNALQRRPMTAAELSVAVYSDIFHVRACVSVLRRQQVVECAARLYTKGPGQPEKIFALADWIATHRVAA